MKISLVQMDIVLGRPEENQNRVADHLDCTMAQESPDIVVLPEMWNTGYDLSRLEEIADRGKLPAWLAELAEKYRVTLVAGSIAEKRDDGFYNTSYVFSPEGKELSAYSKVHLFRLMEEEKYLQPGKRRAPLFSVGSAQAGSMICYDLRFPELSRAMALEGAQLLFVPAEWPHPRLNHWRLLNQARAVENQMIVIAVNRVGSDKNNTFCGHSMVVDPWGEILGETGEEETVLTVEVDPEEVDRVRNKIPVFEDRVPSCYR